MIANAFGPIAEHIDPFQVGLSGRPVARSQFRESRCPSAT
ncbi:hypothetical protein E1H18_2922 [Caulobacter sp. RHG1]|nr:hypothetical protein [Caulobacter sp. RHG1]